MIFGFANKYMEKNGAILIFHDDDLCVLKEIKSLEMNGYEIYFRWIVINFLPWMNNWIKGKMVIPLLNCIYITYHSIKLYWTNSYRSQSCKLDWARWFFLFTKWVDSNFKKITQRWSSLVFLWVKMIFFQIA